jgi:DNA-binding NtrC family response regulator
MAFAILSFSLSTPQSPKPYLPIENLPTSADALSMSSLNRLRDLPLAAVLPARETVPSSPDSLFWLDGSSPAITQLRGQIRRVAPYFRTALLVGEPGCGEHVAAQMLHQLSPLAGHPFLDLASTEAIALFDEGSSEDAVASIGMFFISRPEQLSRSIQARLLYLLRKYRPHAPRIVAFAQQSLRPFVSSNDFSPDLADSLGALRIVIPPLRNRAQDIPHLLTQLLARIAIQSGVRVPELAQDLRDAARSLPWRGNLIELTSAAQGLMERSTQLILHAQDLDAVLGAISPSASPYRSEARMMRLDDVIQEHIRAVLSACNGNKLRTAEVLGISRSTLYRMLEIPIHPCSQVCTLPTFQMNRSASL